MIDHPKKCAACGQDCPAIIRATIERDGFGKGPEVPLCGACGDFPLPTCEDLWAMIRERRASEKAKP